MEPIYLDHNATTPILPEASAAMDDCLLAGPGNPASQHYAGRRARRWLEDARERIARLLGAQLDCAQADRLIFTSGGTEANNLAILGLAGDEPGHAIVSAIEHPSVSGPAEMLAQRGWRIDRLPCDRDGVVLADALAALLRPQTRLVSVMLANNETGVLQDVSRLAEICNAAGVPLHTDAVQAVGKIDVDFRQLGAASLSASGHKFHGPPGIGILLLRPGERLRPRMAGGFQQQGLRPGTEHAAVAVGVMRALECWRAEHPLTCQQLEALRDRLEAQLLAECPELVVHGAAAPRLPQTSNIAFGEVDGQAMLMALDMAKVACSYGSACASGSSEPSAALVAMGLDRRVAERSLRFSLGRATTAAEVDEAARRILKAYNELRSGFRPGKMAGTARKGDGNSL